MNEECLGCEWYNKPYWSIISPCTNCPKRFKNNTIKVTKYSINIEESDLYKEIEDLQQRIEKAIDNLEKSIKSIDEKIAHQDYGKNYINDYRKVRLRAIRSKSKEILSILKGEEK